MKRWKRIVLQVLAVVLLVIGVKLAVITVTGGAPAIIQVVDAVTGDPIPDAAVLAIWWKWTYSRKAWWEGPSIVMADFWEGATDTEGRATIPRFWSGLWEFNPQSKGSTLTVYKPGYVLWNQERIFPGYEKRRGFNRWRHAVRLERWRDDYERWVHDGFLDYCTAGELSTSSEYLGGEKLFLSRFDSGEMRGSKRQRPSSPGR